MSEQEKSFKKLTFLYNEAGARQEFERGCTELLIEKYKNVPGVGVHNVRCSQGDDGIDVFVGKYPDNIDVYQCKYFYDKMNPSRWNQVKKSFERAVNSRIYTMRKWTLCVAVQFSNEDHQRWAELEKEAESHNIEVELWDENKLITEMTDAGMTDRFFQIDESVQLKEIHNYLLGNSAEKQKLLDAFRNNERNETPLNKLIGAYFKQDYDEAKKNYDSILTNHPEYKNDECKNDECRNDDYRNEDYRNDDCRNAAEYWMGMVEKNIGNGNVEASSDLAPSDSSKSYADASLIADHNFEAMKHLEKSELAEAYYERYLIARYFEKLVTDLGTQPGSNSDDTAVTNMQTEQINQTHKSVRYYDKSKKDYRKEAEDMLKKACEADDPRACFKYVMQVTDGEKDSDKKDNKNKKDNKDNKKWKSRLKRYLNPDDSSCPKGDLEIIKKYLETAANAEHFDKRGDAFYYLSEISELEGDEAKQQEYFASGLKYGSKEAFEIKEKESFRNPLTPQNNRLHSLEEKSICIINEVNKATEWFCRSVPASCSIFSTARPTDRDSVIGCEPIRNLIYNQIGADYKVRYILFSEDYHKNLRDAIELLENYRQTSRALQGNNLEIYLLCIVSQAAPIIDTLLNSMGDKIVPVHLIDKHRLSAQMLFSRYPLFYPLYRAESADTYPLPHAESADVRKKVRLLILGSDECALWLVREATACMSFPEVDLKGAREKAQTDNTVKETDIAYMGKVETSITVVSPGADELERQFYTVCPGLSSDSRDKLQEWLPLPEYHFVKASENDEIYFRYIQNAADYIVICGNSDEKNLETAIRVRQLLIQSNQKNPHRMPPVAYECEDAYFSYLGKRTVVENETYGHDWTNSYQLIPFGSGELFTWDHLVNGYENKMALCVHLKYDGVSPEKDHSEAERGYYKREYNRDSSFSVAMSFPYRLWATAKLKNCVNDFFPLWNFEDEAFFLSEKRANAIGEKLDQIRKGQEEKDNTSKELFNSDEADKIAEWEHNRWCRWMLSRGYMPMNTTQMINFINFGNRRQSLAVGKLHALICPFNAIPEVEQKLSIARNDYREPGYLTKYDTDHVQHSSMIWKTEWLKKTDEVK